MVSAMKVAEDRTQRMSILFVTRKFPPDTGGMQRAAYELWRQLSERANVKLIRWGGSNRWLPLVLPYLLLSSLWMLLSTRVDVVYVQDGLLAPLGCLLKILRRPVVVTVHGLDITYGSRVYQMIVPKCVKRMSRVICISERTKRECIERGIPLEKIEVIPDGVTDRFYMPVMSAERHQLRDGLGRKLGLDLSNKRIVLSVGRLVERKGIHWFVRNVIPTVVRYDKDCVYLVVGEGGYAQTINKTVEETALMSHVFMCGGIDDEALRVLYNTADIFVMPNIPVEGDVEGFGLVALEAASCGLPVVASRLEGIEDAVKDGRNGILVDPNDPRGFADTITGLLVNKEEATEFGAGARRFSLDTYGWERVAESYVEEFARLALR